jgi:hypothetical protein
MRIINTITLLGLLSTSQISFSQLWMSAGTSINDTQPLEMAMGYYWEPQAEGSLFPRTGIYMNFGFGEGDYEMMGAKYYSTVSQSEANGWGDDIVGYQSAGGLFYFGGGLMAGLNNPDSEDKIGHWLLLGGEVGGDGPIQQVRHDPMGILGGGTYAIDSNMAPTEYATLRLQYLADISNWLFGVGYLFGTHSGVTFQIGYDITGLY